MKIIVGMGIAKCDKCPGYMECVEEYGRLVWICECGHREEEK